MKQHDTPEKNYDLERLIFFSDGVFAIAITLLAIELHAPEDWNGHFDTLIGALAAKLIFYFISFVAIGLYWMAHRFVFRYVQRFNEFAAFLNIIFLCLICLTPFVNGLTGERGLTMPVFTLYFGLMAGLSVMLGLMWGYISLVGNLTDPRMTAAFKWISLLRMCFTPLIIGGGSMWVGLQWGILPSIAFVVLGGLLSSRIRLKPFSEKAGDAE